MEDRDGRKKRTPILWSCRLFSALNPAPHRQVRRKQGRDATALPERSGNAVLFSICVKCCLKAWNLKEERSVCRAKSRIKLFWWPESIRKIPGEDGNAAVCDAIGKTMRLKTQRPFHYAGVAEQ
ncbi:hypothetical protein KIF59_16295 [Enterobacter cloacae subsp. cloacae]|nr:hypothetical protein [Enterobacter cloacae subsp. cloacae]